MTIDRLWGEPAVAAMGAAARFGRHVQVGHIAGPELTLPRAAIRSKSLDVRGFSWPHPPAEMRGDAYLRLGEHVARGDIVVDVERVPLADVAARVGAPAPGGAAARSAGPSIPAKGASDMSAAAPTPAGRPSSSAAAPC